MTQQDQTAPATKQDIGMLMESIGRLYDATERWKDEMVDHMASWKGELQEKMESWKGELRDDIGLWKGEITSHFDVAVEHIHHEMLHANREEIAVLKDRTKDHGGRIRKLEAVTGLSA